MTETFHAGPGLGRLSDVTIIHGDCGYRMCKECQRLRRSKSWLAS